MRSLERRIFGVTERLTIFCIIMDKRSKLPGKGVQP